MLIDTIVSTILVTLYLVLSIFFASAKHREFGKEITLADGFYIFFLLNGVAQTIYIINYYTEWMGSFGEIISDILIFIGIGALAFVSEYIIGLRTRGLIALIATLVVIFVIIPLGGYGIFLSILLNLLVYGNFILITLRLSRKKRLLGILIVLGFMLHNAGMVIFRFYHEPLYGKAILLVSVLILALLFMYFPAIIELNWGKYLLSLYIIGLGEKSGLVFSYNFQERKGAPDPILVAGFLEALINFVKETLPEKEVIIRNSIIDLGAISIVYYIKGDIMGVIFSFRPIRILLDKLEEVLDRFYRKYKDVKDWNKTSQFEDFSQDIEKLFLTRISRGIIKEKMEEEFIEGIEEIKEYLRRNRYG